jgi:hypothetical protein
MKLHWAVHCLLVDREDPLLVLRAIQVRVDMSRCIPIFCRGSKLLCNAIQEDRHRTRAAARMLTSHMTTWGVI